VTLALGLRGGGRDREAGGDYGLGLLSKVDDATAGLPTEKIPF
jgi:hypothetical protein